MRWATTLSSKIVFPVWSFVYQTAIFLLILSRNWDIWPVILRNSRYLIWNDSVRIWFRGYRGLIFGEGILPFIDTWTSWNTSSQLTAVRFVDQILLLLYTNLLLLPCVVEVIADKDVIIINCMIQLLLSISLLVLLVAVVIYVIAFAHLFERLVWFHIRVASCRERVYRLLHHRRTILHLMLIVWLVRSSNRTFLYCLIWALHYLLTCVHIEILINNMRLLVDSLLGYHSHRLRLLEMHGWVRNSMRLCKVLARLTEVHYLYLLRLLVHLHARDHWLGCRTVLWWKLGIFKCASIWVLRIESHLIVLWWPNSFIYLYRSTSFVGWSDLLHGEWHVLSNSLLWNHLIFVHQLVMLHVLVVGLSRVYFLDLSNILFHFFEVGALEFSVLVQKCTLLAITEHQRWYFFKIEVFVACEGENFVVVEVVHDDEYLWVAVADDLFCLAEETSFLHIEELTLLLGFFLIWLIHLASIGRWGCIHIVHYCFNSIKSTLLICEKLDKLGVFYFCLNKLLFQFAFFIFLTRSYSF